MTVIKRCLGGGGMGKVGTKKHYSQLILHMCSSFIFNIHKMISFSILRIKISTVKYGIRVDGTVGSGYQFRVDKWSNEL